MKKTPPGIYPRNKFTKFQHNPTIFESSRLPRSFRSILGPILSYWAQKTKFSKNEKNTPRYSPKEQVCKISAKSNNFWSLQAAPKFLGTHRHTDTHTDRQTLSDSSSTEVENTYIQTDSNVLTALAQLQSSIHPRNNCTKFQKNPVIFRTSRLPRSFWSFWDCDRDPGPKIKIFRKWKN